MIRHDIPKSAQMICHHFHHPDGWLPPQLSDGTMCYPDIDEAEYTANLAFQIALVVSLWACRVDEASLRVPQGPPAVSRSGNRSAWLLLDPRARRKQAGTHMALALGLDGSLALRDSS